MKLGRRTGGVLFGFLTSTAKLPPGVHPSHVLCRSPFLVLVCVRGGREGIDWNFVNDDDVKGSSDIYYSFCKKGK